MPRMIFHVDLDAFFVAVERTLDPALNGRPVIVGGSVGSRGVVACASYEARAFGVHSAMPMAVARRLCPQAVYIQGKHDLYREVSRRFMSILRQHSPLVEEVSVDEAYLDMTGTERLFGMPEEAARRLRERIAAETGVTASIGVGDSKLVAKVASGACKPDGLLIVPPGGAGAFLAPLPVRKLPGIGPRAEQALGRLGIETLGELAAYPAGPLRRALGRRSAESLKQRAAGSDDSPVVAAHEAKSISAETTFAEDSSADLRLRSTLRALAEKVGGRLRKSGKRARSVTLKLRYHDFETITRQATFPRPADGDEAIYSAAEQLMRRALRKRRAKVRLLGVGVGNFTEPMGQLSLLETPDEHDSRLSGAVDEIRARFGRDAIQKGALE